MTDWPDVLVAVDVGTSAARAAAFDTEGRRRLEVRRPYPTAAPRPGWAEQSAADWRRASLAALRTLVAALGPRRRVLAIGLTGQCPSVVLIDRRGRAVGPGLIYRDNRATVEAAEIRDRFTDAGIHARTGHLPAAFHVAPKLLWLARHEPAALAAAALALQPRDWIALVLTGTAVTDGTHAAATLLYDLRAGRWADDIVSALDLPPSLLPPIAGSAEIVGTLRPAVASRVGLPAGTPVVLGGADSQACAFGAGVVSSGPVSEMAGSSTCLNAAVAAPLDDVAITHYPHVVPGPFTTETGINTTGAAVGWVADRLYARAGRRTQAADFERLDREAAAIPAGADGVVAVPVLGDGERTDPTLRGALTGLSLRHDRATIGRAMLEGVAFAIADQLDLLARAGAAPTELRVSGGDARLATWNRIKADVLGVPVRTVPGDAAVTGVAMLAGLGSGTYRTPADAIDRCVHPDPPIEPDRATAEPYARARAAYRALAGSAAARREAGRP
jgi:sugar (pentulose or hexulose) kinase